MSHILSEITIENYKSIINEKFELANFTPMVGYNNAGKSNILSGIKWLLRGGSLPIESFNKRSNPISIEGKIQGIDVILLQMMPENHRKSIQPYIIDDELMIKRVQTLPSESNKNIKLLVFDPTKKDWVCNPNGIDNALNILFPEPIHIGAMENAEEDASKSKATTTIGKLLAEIIEPIENQYGEKVRESLNGLRGLLDADSLERAPALNQFDREVNEKIDAFFPDVTIKIHIPTPELKDVFSKGTIKIYENQSPNSQDFSTLGHGAQRSIQMALIRHLAELKRSRENHTTTTLLLIDEPELYLHPQAIEIIRDALNVLSKDGYQVIFSTHSAMMVTQEDIGNSILIRKNRELGTFRRKTLKSAISEIEADAQSQLHLMFSLSNSSNILFSDRILLTEGKTEKRILPKIFEKITGKTLGMYKYALVSQGGVANTKKSMKVLNTMDLPTKAIVDLDYAFNYAIINGFIDEADSDISFCHQFFNTLAKTNSDIELASNGYPKNKSGGKTAYQAFEFMAEQNEVQESLINIHSKLLSHNIWIWRKGAIEKHLGLKGKNESSWANFVNQLITKNLNEVVTDHLGITDCVNWLLI